VSGLLAPKLGRDLIRRLSSGTKGIEDPSLTPA
jgi:hypothetical protein